MVDARPAEVLRGVYETADPARGYGGGIQKSEHAGSDSIVRPRPELLDALKAAWLEAKPPTGGKQT